MFGIEFYPTPPEVIEQMLEGYSVQNKIVLEPSAGKGNIVDYCKLNGATEVIACETNKDLQAILANKCRIISSDFFELTPDKISHINAIIMNPPFSNADKHILHAWEIAPEGCIIISLCNSETVTNRYSGSRGVLSRLIEEYGHTNRLGNCFSEAERFTDVSVNVIRLQKPGENRDSEFEGFFLEDDAPELHANAIMPYNFIRDLVQRYTAAVKLFDVQLQTGVQMNELIGIFYQKPALAFVTTQSGAPKLHNDLKKDLQQSAWRYIFSKMNMDKHATQGLRSDINKFVEQQENIPFTMRNIYRMLEIVNGTTASRMDKALEEVFDKLTQYTEENRLGVEGWKTNSHYLMNEKFIMPWMVEASYRGRDHMTSKTHNNFELIEDLVKALCYITGQNYDDHISLSHKLRYPYKLKINGKYINQVFDDFHRKDAVVEEYRLQGIKVDVDIEDPVFGQWFTWGFFTCKGFKKGTMHFKFNDPDIWGKFNQHIARIKGYPLFEYKPKRKAEAPEKVVSPTAVAVYRTPVEVAEVITKQTVTQPELMTSDEW